MPVKALISGSKKCMEAWIDYLAGSIKGQIA